MRIKRDDTCAALLGVCLAHSTQETRAAPPQSTAGDKEMNKLGSDPWVFSVHCIKRRMMLICPITGDIDIYHLIKMIFARFLHCKVN